MTVISSLNVITVQSVGSYQFAILNRGHQCDNKQNTASECSYKISMRIIRKLKPIYLAEVYRFEGRVDLFLSYQVPGNRKSCMLKTFVITTTNIRLITLWYCVKINFCHFFKLHITGCSK